MALELSLSRDGLPLCSADGSHLHSPYSPSREAERFLEAVMPSSSPSVVVLLGPCIDYLTPLIKRRLPGARVVSIQYSEFFRGKERRSADAAWYPGSAQPLADFVFDAIGDEAESGIAVLDWEPAARAFPSVARVAREALVVALDRLTSSAATVKSCGWNWLLNSCRSFLLAERSAAPPVLDGPAVVAAPGPSLEEALKLLASFRGRFRLLALSSALSACRAAGLEPDLVVSTDGGYWSRLHLYPLSQKPAALACPLSTLPSSSLWPALPLLLLDQGSFADSELLPLLGGGLRIPPHGTVAGSALRLAALLCRGPIVAVGLDLAARGEAEHARPHGFDAAISGGAGRLAPAEARVWARRNSQAAEPLGGGWFGSRSMAVYAAALSRDAAALQPAPCRLLPSPRRLPGFREVGPSEAVTLFHEKLPPLELAVATLPPASAREAALAERLAGWKAAAAGACLELAASRPLPPGPASELLRSLDLPFWAAATRAIARADDPGPAARALATRAAERLAELEERLIP